ncbi:unnamed protein product [Gordionus sp. m RMFG-2023]
MYKVFDGIKDKTYKYYNNLKLSINEDEDKNMENLEITEEYKLENKKNASVGNKFNILNYDIKLENFVGVANKASHLLKTTLIDTANIVKSNLEENTILADFNKEQQNFESELKKDGTKESENCSSLWQGHPKKEILKKQILALSQDARNFLRNPPEGCDFQFDFHQNAPYAMCMLNEDPKLSLMRFKLVPTKVKEEIFWRNYFYRVSLIKQSINLYEEINNNPPTIKELDNKPINLSEKSKKTETPSEGTEDEYDMASNPPTEFISDNIIDEDTLYEKDGSHDKKTKSNTTKVKSKNYDYLEFSYEFCSGILS